MPLVIPTARAAADPVQAYGVTVPIEGVAYRFDFAWNTRGAYWAATVSDGAGNVLVRRTLRIGALFFGLHRPLNLAGFPPGEIIVADTTGQDLDPGLTDLGSRVQLVYLTAAEIAAAAAT